MPAAVLAEVAVAVPLVAAAGGGGGGGGGGGSTCCCCRNRFGAEATQSRSSRRSSRSRRGSRKGSHGLMQLFDPQSQNKTRKPAPLGESGVLLVSRLITPVTHIVTLMTPIINLVAKSP